MTAFDLVDAPQDDLVPNLLQCGVQAVRACLKSSGWHKRFIRKAHGGSMIEAEKIPRRPFSAPCFIASASQNVDYLFAHGRDS
jgi:hypothetical protein